MLMENRIAEPAPRAMYKGELALAYNPTMDYKHALNTLSRWIKLKPGLLDDLMATGYRMKQKLLTPIQVRLIFDALGEP